VLFVLAAVEGHGHLLKATVRPGAPSETHACAANAPGGTCPAGNALSLRKLIPRSGNDGVCAIPPGCVLGCPNQQGALPGEPPCANEGICDHCALEKTAGEKPIVGGDGSKWWTRMPAAHWDEPDQWPKYPCMSIDEFGTRGTASVTPGDPVETVMYVNADHSGLYRFELSCGSTATNANFNAAPVTPWKALHVSKELAPGDTPLGPGREVGSTRTETDAYWARTICTAATCAYRMNGAQPQYPGGAYDINSPQCQQGTLGVQCFVRDTFTVPADTSCRGPATLRWMWNSAEGPETYANCLDLAIEGSAIGDGTGGLPPPPPGSNGGIGGGLGQGRNDNSGDGGSNTTKMAAAALVVFLGAVGVVLYRKKKSVPTLGKHDSADPRWATESPAVSQPPPPPPPPPQGALPDGWKEVQDTNYGQPYYYHAASGKTTWVRPEDGVPSASAPGGPGVELATSKA